MLRFCFKLSTWQKSSDILERQIVVVILIQVICWGKCLCWWHWRRGAWRSFLKAFHSPTLDGIKIFGFTLWTYPFATSQVDAYLHVLSHLKIVQQIGLILYEFHHNVLWVLLFSRHNHFSFSKPITSK